LPFGLGCSVASIAQPSVAVDVRRLSSILTGNFRLALTERLWAAYVPESVVGFVSRLALSDSHAPRGSITVVFAAGPGVTAVRAPSAMPTSLGAANAKLACRVVPFWKSKQRHAHV